MPLDCDDLRACAELLHEGASREMDAAQRQGRHQLDYIHRLRRVVQLEETAVAVEQKVDDEC